MGGGGMAYQSAYDLGNTAPRHSTARVQVVARRSHDDGHTIDDLFGPAHERWMQDAACAQAGNADAWFPTKGNHNSDAKAVLRICRSCPVQRECLAYALHMDANPEGIWGGTTHHDRRLLRDRNGTRA